MKRNCIYYDEDTSTKRYHKYNKSSCKHKKEQERDQLTDCIHIHKDGRPSSASCSPFRGQALWNNDIQPSLNVI